MNLGTRLVIVLSVACLMSASLASIAQPAEEPSGRAIYDQTLRCTCWVRLPKGFGSGSLVDKSKKWVLTSCHVVQNFKTATVYFPVFDDKGKAIVEHGPFEKASKPVRGKVILRDSSHDLALLELESLPEGATEIKLAEKAATVGERVHAVGNGKSNGGLFGYHAGFVRQICARTDSYAGVKIVNCRVLETQSPHNPGDSGGPTVNDKCELVGVTAAYIVPAQLVSFHIDISEIREFLAKAGKEP